MRENEKPDYGEKPLRVIAIDFDMKFGTMVIFLLKLALAAVPAALMVAAVVGLLAGALGRLIRALP